MTDRHRLLLVAAGLCWLLAGGDVPVTDADEAAAPAVAPAAPARESAQVLVSSVIGAGGAPGASGGFAGNGTLGQPTPIGIGTGGQHRLYAGFWGVIRRLAVTGMDLVRAPRNRLLQNAPNPFNPMTVIEFVTGAVGHACLEVYDLRGVRVRSLVDDVVPAGTHKAIWDGLDDAGRQMPSGVYCYRLRAADFSAIRKLLLVK